MKKSEKRDIAKKVHILFIFINITKIKCPNDGKIPPLLDSRLWYNVCHVHTFFAIVFYFEGK